MTNLRPSRPTNAVVLRFSCRLDDCVVVYSVAVYSFSRSGNAINYTLTNPALATLIGPGTIQSTLTNVSQFRVPNSYTVPAHGYLLVWADNETGQNAIGRADLHVNFKLEKNGESIGLFAPDGTLIDSVAFSLQANNVSQGRSPDGGTNFLFFKLPTPGYTNLSQPTAPFITGFEWMATPPATVKLTFTTTPGFAYRVDFKNALTEEAWIPLAPEMMASGTVMSVTNGVSGETQRYYRVVVP